ncbi:MAG TPA: hypothetical protein VF898_14005 [Chloroflexota bacterium]
MPHRAACARRRTARGDRRRGAAWRSNITTHLRIRNAALDPTSTRDASFGWLVEVYHDGAKLWAPHDELPQSANLDVYATRKRSKGFRVIVQR